MWLKNTSNPELNKYLEAYKDIERNVIISPQVILCFNVDGKTFSNELLSSRRMAMRKSKPNTSTKLKSQSKIAYQVMVLCKYIFS